MLHPRRPLAPLKLVVHLTCPCALHAPIIPCAAVWQFELRQFVINGEIRHKIYSNFAWTDTDGYLREFVMKDRAEATRDWMSGDDEAMAMAEKKAAKLVRAWLAWMTTQSVEALPGVRMDILIRRTGPGKAEVFTLELTELGFSMLTWPKGPPIVFSALLKSCFEDTGPTDEEAKLLVEGATRVGAAQEAVAPAAAAAAAASKRKRVDNEGRGAYSHE